MNWQTIIDPAICGRLCLTLLHSLWQVALLALLARGIEWLWARHSPEKSYTVYVAALVAALVAMPITFAMVYFDPTVAANNGDKTNAAPAPQAVNAPILNATAAEVAQPVANGNVLPQSSQATSRGSTSRVTESNPIDWVDVAPWIMASYVLGVMVMLLRLTAGIIGAHRIATRAEIIQDGPFVDLLQTLARNWSMAVVPALACAERLVVPKVVGLIRPTILLPATAITGLSIPELEMVLAHELAHVKRYDMWVNLMQRLAEAVLFFNPALWYLSRRISAHREFCCDELTCDAMARSHTNPRAQYAWALLRVVELSHRLPDSSNLAALAASGRSPSELRRRVARLFGEPIRDPLRFSRGGVVAILFATVLVLGAVPMWRTSANSAEPESKQAASDRKEGREFNLQVVSPDGNPVPNAEVEIRLSPAPKPEHVLRGEFVKAGRSASAKLKADQEGRLVITIPPKPKSFTVHIEHAGYAPYWAQWDTYNQPEEIPTKHVAELDAGWAVGGVVVDEDGKPVEGVEVGVSSIRFKMRPGDLQELHVGTELKTAADGTWSYGCVPASMDSASFTFNHPKFMAERAAFPRGQYDAAGNGKTEAKVELKRGLSITGTVTDDSGQPVSGALVRTKFVNEQREARTGDDGKYELVGCEPRMARIVVSSPGKAMDMKEVRIGQQPEPVDFVLKPGGHLRVIALDENGKPIPKTRIFFQQWRGRIEYFEFDHVNGYADENGVWEWNEAPHDAIVADICRPEGMQLVDQVLMARDEQYTFKPPKALVISGAVTDAETKEPIKKFRVIPGLLFPNSPDVYWNRQDSYDAVDGKYSIKKNREYLAHFVRIEADGYRAAKSRSIKSNEGSITIDFALERGENISTSVLTPEGDPAAGAKVAIGVAGSHISIENGDLRQGSSRAAFVEADGSGRVKCPPQDGDFNIIVTHPTGYAHVKALSETAPESIRLSPWGRIEGVYRVGQKPAPNITLEFDSNAINAPGQNDPSMHASHRVTTGPDGEFVFERIFAGRGWLGRQIIIMVGEGATEVASSKRVPLEVVAGQTTQVNVGGDGTTVVGKLAAAGGVNDEVPWHFAQLNVRIEVPPAPPVPVPAAVQNDNEAAQAWFKEWQLSPEGIAWKGIREANQRLSESSPSFTATVDRDGSFRIDDVPSGNYTLSMYFDHQKPAPGQLRDYKFAVPAGTDAASEPLDLGVVQLER